MRIISKRTLIRFWKQPSFNDAKHPLESWYEEASKANWTKPSLLKRQYANASFCGKNRVVFNIAGNKYRLIVEIQYQSKIIWIKFVGTHKQYDAINVETVNDY